jgi:Putative phage serine protease XkdF
MGDSLSKFGFSFIPQRGALHAHSFPSPSVSSPPSPSVCRKQTSYPLLIPLSTHPALKHLVYFPIYSPWVVDVQDEAITDAELMVSAHDWMLRGRMANVDVEHAGEVVNCRVVESWIVRGTEKGADGSGWSGDYPYVGTWAAGMRVYDDAIWEKIERGEINGVSLLSEYPPIRRKEPGTVVQSPVRAVGITETWGGGDGISNLPAHTHPVDISFDDDGEEEMPWFTGVGGDVGKNTGYEHIHPGRYVTATELCRDKDWQGKKGMVPHAHRIGMDRLTVNYRTMVKTVSWMSGLSVIAISLVQHGANWMPFSVVSKSAGARVGGRHSVSWPSGARSEMLSGFGQMSGRGTQ